MTKRIVLFDKIYNVSSEKRKKDIYLRYLKYLNDNVKGFSKNSLMINKLRNFDQRFEISIHGPDENFIYNLLQKEIGTITEFKDIKEGQLCKGSMVDVGKVGFGIFIDCAIFNPKVDVLINLHSLRSQLCNGKGKSLREIIEAYDFIDNFPVYVKILKIDKVNQKLQGEIAQKTLTLFNKVLKENIEGVFLSGETKGQFKKALVKNGHSQDIISIKRFGFLENLVLLKKDSNAPGIIAHIGRDLTNCKLSALRPTRIKTLFE
ncbi:MAG: DUF2110 family protein [Promethearchaeota archaeon]